MGVHAAAAAVFPDTGVGLEGEPLRLDSRAAPAGEQPGIARARQPAVEEHRHRGEDDAAERIVLDLPAAALPTRTGALLR